MRSPNLLELLEVDECVVVFCGVGQGVFSVRCLANMAHIRQSRPESGLGFQVNVLQLLQVVPSSLGSGCSDAWPGGGQHSGVIDSGLVCSLWEGTTRAEDAKGAPTQNHVSPIILVYEY